jgi:hypothetical protein
MDYQPTLNAFPPIRAHATRETVTVHIGAHRYERALADLGLPRDCLTASPPALTSAERTTLLQSVEAQVTAWVREISRELRPCPQCGEVVTGPVTKRFCSPTCRWTAKDAKRRQAGRAAVGGDARR